MKRWFLNRLIEENPQFTPEFAFMGTVNWVNCLALSCSDLTEISKYEHSAHCNESVNDNVCSQNRVFESLFMAQHSLVALNSIIECVTFPNDISKVCVFAWSDCIFNAAKAMLTCYKSTCPSDEEVFDWWYEFVNQSKIIPTPFNLQFENITEASISEFSDRIRAGNFHTLNNVASDAYQAKGGLVSYLTGTAKYYAYLEKEKMLMSDFFKTNQLDNFRKKIAIAHRDAVLSQKNANFLSCVHRFKGKVLERDSIFLSYGKEQDEKVTEMLLNLNLVARAFFNMAELYCSKVIERSSWRLFKADLNENSRLTEIY